MHELNVLEVLQPGLQTTVQDLGRPGYLADGIPPSGAFDGPALKLANLVVGNDVGDYVLVGTDPGAAGLEMLLSGPTLRALGSTVIAVTGADMQPRVNGEPVPMWTSIAVRAGDEIALGAARTGARTYLAVAGGIAVPPVLGSRATNVRAGIGGHAGRALQTRDVLAARPRRRRVEELAGRRIRRDRLPGYRPVLRVVLGPQDHLFTPESVRTFLQTAWRLSPISDRMGCRFVGPPLHFLPRPDHLVGQAGSDPSNIVDDAICVGSIQVPSGLEPIVMGVDGPSLGGYAKIATVISADLPALAQLRPGDSVRFCAVDSDEALEAHVAARSIGFPDFLEKK
ncbi:biotin-dependent carboxyltransferase family protein [Pseudonocardia alaniniphila]|uniref:Biotin-dependent carboxyltransferase family protein n=1 Tax=Pseudonocardia alaniniphila TaxID=75291 RepID=A0ABS9TAL1_9PSEU|nr:biotin-dependent carboxyltransferase family protein [Pseudonocardia alaniniphila]MCH6165570.1 biotin-dependent carboxyltransferase family protein [Pseudonocardia alaniniphila]